MNNNESPLIPQGSLLEQKNKSRIRVKIAVFFVLAIHGLGLMALLMIGCQKEKEPAPIPMPTPDVTNAAPTLEPTNVPTLPESNAAPSVPTATTAAPPSLPPATMEPTPTPAVTPLPTVGGAEYKVQKGDTLAKIAKKSHVTLQALQGANPGVDSSKLKIGQSLQIPAPAVAAPTAMTSAAVTPTTPEPAAAGAEQEYTVKSGDSLTKIASQFKVNIKAIRAANHLKTDKIKVGQKIKIPGKAAAPAPAPAAEPLPSTTTPTGR